MFAKQQSDPWAFQILVTLLFAGLVFLRLTIPSHLYFDEIHYVPAARAMIAGHPANPEHPMLAKAMIAGSIRIFGDNPLGWRMPSALMGVIGLWAFGRALWYASGRAMASVAGMVLLATDFAWYVQSRIAMLDMVMAGLAMVALWLIAGAIRRTDGARWRIVGAGLVLGLSLGAKWSVLPVWAVVVALVLGARLWTFATGGRPILPALSMVELGLCLIVLPLGAYWLTYLPGFFTARDAVPTLDPLGWHRHMIDLQSSVTKHHPYQSVWSQWIINWRAIWYLYEVTDGAQRGVMLIGNPFTMIAGLIALIWAGWSGMRRGAWLPLVLVALYCASLGLWIVGNKPVQFYYHYLLPGTFLMGALGLMVDELWASRGQRRRHEAFGVLVLSLGVFAWFFPILSAAALTKGVASFEDWMWLASWR
ncbi:dolichyl-phosphate-mannose--protein O-mannosyl transferase [Novosphingobium sp. SG751A]|uniref:glycosyltransferase family 39 protein n=1 Tax=Novosphingobium sp. SG751A TaxID=2587000 RepID=UPI001556F642|nr:glycosyltransferase family 39 protein [Novosphingobium sp. SG751A]NOW47056.1 dolichyl-phosphate-mannose--protein O-mannosyl transferase [Novosphingobium sp. SG751A]